MAQVRVTAERSIGVPAERVYAYIADYREHHHRFLPPAFSDFHVEEGGVGAGTVVRFRLFAGGRERAYRQRVEEPQPGRVLTESDLDSSSVTTFTVTPEGEHSRVQILTTWQGARGVGGSSSDSLPRVCCAASTPTSWSASTDTPESGSRPTLTGKTFEPPRRLGCRPRAGTETCPTSMPHR